VVQPNKGLRIYSADTGGKDVFVHISAVEKAGLSNLNEGAKVSYEVVANRGKESAENSGSANIVEVENQRPPVHAGGLFPCGLFQRSLYVLELLKFREADQCSTRCFGIPVSFSGP